ncbi:hypothetical protein ZYGR_0I01360 [Zygosaccharomyces rouxii]|uniref:ZYRO0C03256p n=2 Tax=Zygosaccharomyces rouxii TaxID=4956 RepID=C5DSV3_ZYGRC|nr:uncharacterized protein ZYRO0C03256g [Zygosaccharomyces rouxii]KAH9201946.1 Sodium/calcium exchanger protein-domain-containing protein [Zygosaccharomyces rouxii]GAV47840.1 hypothetical protein ZYGR_0I01360 [Zygosaccharomyces rouxii]CAR26864.1 ZYRO0C03256p [Zygosaccharomyces rouxii]
MSGSKDNNNRLHALHSNGTAASGQDHVYHVFSVDDDPNEIEHDIRYLEGLHDGLKYTLNNKISRGGTPQNALPPNADFNDSHSGGNTSNSSYKRKTNNQQQGQLRERPSKVKILAPVKPDSTDSSRNAQHGDGQGGGGGEDGGDNGSRGTHQQHEHQHPADKLLLHDYDDETGSQHNLMIGNPDATDEENGPSSDQVSVADSLESYTLRERQHAINETHPFGIRIWKPALYKKKRSVQKVADEDIHETHLKTITWWVRISNILWSISCGLFLFLMTVAVSLVVLVLGLFTCSAREYSIVLWRLAFYLIWPFGKVVYLNFDEQYMQEDKDEGISAQQFYKWVTTYSNRLFFHRSQTQDNTPLLGDNQTSNDVNSDNRWLNENQHPKPSYGSTESHQQQQQPQQQQEQDSDDTGRPPSSRTAIQRRYFGRGKWTWGRFIFYTCFYLILQPIVCIFALITWLTVFTIPMSNILWNLMYHFRRHPLALGFKSIKNKAKPGETIASGDKDSRSILLCTFRCAGWHYYKFTVDGTNVIVMNLVTLVFFTIFDFYALKKLLGSYTWISNDNAIFTLCLASIIPLAFYIGQAVASISAQTSMGLGAVINAFFSTVVEIFLYCVAIRQGKGLVVEGSMIGSILGAVLLLPGLSMCGGALKRKTQRYNPKSASVSSTMLIFSMIVMFVPTLLYEIYGGYVVKCDDGKRYDLSVSSVGKALSSHRCTFSHPPLKFNKMYTHVIEPMSVSCAVVLSLAYLIGLWFTLRTHAVMIWQFPISEQNKEGSRILEPAQSNTGGGDTNEANADESGGHESPNWSRGKSTFILLFATVLYAIIAEILVSCVDGVLESSSLDPKFLGLTILALVPNSTEFLNAISFATHGNVALSMEIGSAYALQVCLLQIPALVVYSIWYTWNWKHSTISIRDQMFALVFPKWDLIATVASVFMFTYLYAEGKSNYFKGSVLILLYVIVIFGFYFQGLVDNWDSIEVNH